MGPISWSMCCAFKWNGVPSLHPSVSQCHATVWCGWLTGRLHFGVNRKRIQARKLSNVKSRGIVTQRARSPNSQKEHSTSVEKGVLIFAWSLASPFQTGMGEANVGRHQLASSSADNFCDLCNPTLHTRHHFGIWLHGSNYPSRGFSSLHLYWKCAGVSPTTTLTVLNLFLCFYFTEVSEKRHKTWSYVFYFVPDYHPVRLCHKETFQTVKKNIKRKGKSIKFCNVEKTPVNILMKLLPRSSTFSGFVWNFQKQTFTSESSLLGSHSAKSRSKERGMLLTFHAAATTQGFPERSLGIRFFP